MGILRMTLPHAELIDAAYPDRHEAFPLPNTLTEIFP